MKYHSTWTSALLALFISAGLCTAQTTTTPTYESTVTTAIVGWAPASQTAQLNVVNTIVFVPLTTSGSPTTTAGATCPVELEFVDGQNNVLKSLQVANVEAGTSASLTLKLADLTAVPALRVGIRGVVKSSPLVTGPIAVTGTMIPAFVFPACSIMPSLDLFDNTTGVTQTFTSDTHPVGTALAVPLPVTGTAN
jgi:hypothetical protein